MTCPNSTYKAAFILSWLLLDLCKTGKLAVRPLTFTVYTLIEDRAALFGSLKRIEAPISIWEASQSFM